MSGEEAERDFEAGLVRLQETINYRFRNPELLTNALTHSSYIYEQGLGYDRCYERLEFLGDSVLQLRVSEYLIGQYPELSEGDLSKLRVSVVNGKNLTEKAKKINLGEHIRFGKGEISTGGAEKGSILSDVFEALIGAIHLDSDGSAEFTGQFISRHAGLNEVSMHSVRPVIAILNEYAGKNGIEDMRYEIVKTEGTDHDPVFFCELRINDKLYGSGKGGSKRKARHAAAYEAVEKLNL